MTASFHPENDQSAFSEQGLTLEELDRIRETCLRFEQAWKHGSVPRMEDFLESSDGVERTALLRRLLLIDVECGRRSGKQPSMDEYLARFPEHRALLQDVMDPRLDASLPEAIADYRVVSRLGEGGQSTVYRVVHPTLEKELVLKLSHTSLQHDEAGAGRLVEEARLLADLDHPHLARIYDLGLHEGRPFLVMEYVRGRSLRDVARKMHLRPDGAAALVAKVGRALHFAHQRGLVHRDVKPENIVLDEAGEPRLIDFGLARVEDAWALRSPGVAEIAGTIGYMAPEQARGQGEAVGPASDIFALGAVLYWLLCGKDPFYEEGESFESALVRSRGCEFDHRALEASGIPGKLRRLCLKAMASNPRDRHESASGFAADLESWMRRPVRIRKLAAAIAGLAFLCGLLLVLRPPGSRPGLDAVPSSIYGLQEPPAFGRGDDFLAAPPLRSGDTLALTWSIPAGLEPALFWFDSRGELRCEDLGTVESGEERQVLRYPKTPDMFMKLDQEPGTEVIFLCARRGRPLTKQEVAEIMDAAEPWPSPPANTVVHFDSQAVWTEPPGSWKGPEVAASGGSRGPAGEEEAPEGVVARANDLRRRLESHCEFVRGIVFLHLR